MLDSVDLKVRLSKATELVDRHLQVKVQVASVVPIRFFLESTLKSLVHVGN